MKYQFTKKGAEMFPGKELYSPAQDSGNTMQFILCARQNGVDYLAGMNLLADGPLEIEAMIRLGIITEMRKCHVVDCESEADYYNYQGQMCCEAHFNQSIT